MSFSCGYTLSTLSAKGLGKVSRSAVVVATFWLALVMVGSYPLVGDGGSGVASLSPCIVSLAIMARYASSVDLQWCNSVSWASMAARSLASSPRHCAALRSTSTYRTCCCSS
jgi:hypothetical protein